MSLFNQEKKPRMKGKRRKGKIKKHCKGHNETNISTLKIFSLKYTLSKLCQVMYFAHPKLYCIKFNFVTTAMYIKPVITKM